MDVIIFAFLAAGFKGGQEDAELAKSPLRARSVRRKDNDTSFIIIIIKEGRKVFFSAVTTPLIDAKQAE